MAGLAAALIGTVAGPTAPGATGEGSRSSYVVELQHGVAVPAVVVDHPIEPSARFTHALNGFVADLSPAQVAALQHDPAVIGLVPNSPIQMVAPAAVEDVGLGDLQALVDALLQAVDGLLAPQAAPPAPQVVPNAVRRVGATASPTARIDGVDDRVDATIAVIDTGIDPTHPDLAVVGGHDCTSSDPTRWGDDHGHGTMVAGVAAAIDNQIGVVGVAPGARLLAVKAVDAQGNGTVESLVCAIDWASDPAHGADVINISLGWPGRSDDQCGALSGDLVHRAICRAAQRGLTVVGAAGNEAVDVAGALPAAYPEVLTVSGIADFDGSPGGLSAPTDCDTSQVDDHFRRSSNFGERVELAAPAACVVTTAMGGGYARSGGTSLAAPAVSGAVALLVHRFGPLTPAEVVARLQALAEPGPIPGDPDAHPEGVLDVSAI